MSTYDPVNPAPTSPEGAGPVPSAPQVPTPPAASAPGAAPHEGTSEPGPQAPAYGYGTQAPAPLPPTAQVYQQAPAGYGYPGSSTEQNSLGNWALGLAIASFVVFGIILSIPAVILGRKGMSAADEGRATNRGIAQAGFIVGIINIVLCVLGAGLFVLVLALGLAAGADPTVGLV